MVFSSQALHIRLDLVKNNLQEWEIYVVGPPETPYEGGVYKAIMRFPDEYPIKPPSLQFMCGMLHPNIYKDGKVCISTLQAGPEGVDKAGHYWRPVLGIEQAILSVVSLLSDPNLDDPANTGAANLYRNHKNEFIQRCVAFAKKSMSLVPEDFEYPKVDHTKKKEKREGLRPVTEEAVEVKTGAKPVVQKEAVVDDEDQDEEFTYDLEDMNRDEDDDEIKIANKDI